MHSLQNSPKTLLKTPSTPQNRQTSETFRLLTDPQKRAHLDLAPPSPSPPPPSSSAAAEAAQALTHSQGSTVIAAAVKRCPTPN